MTEWHLIAICPASMKHEKTRVFLHITAMTISRRLYANLYFSQSRPECDLQSFSAICHPFSCLPRGDSPENKVINTFIMHVSSFACGVDFAYLLQNVLEPGTFCVLRLDAFQRDSNERLAECVNVRLEHVFAITGGRNDFRVPWIKDSCVHVFALGMREV